MRRILETLGAACLLTAALVAPASGQEDELPHPLEILIDAFESPEGEEFVARFIRDPLPAVGSVEDPVGDFVHPTGQEPGFTPNHLDITSTWALELNPGPIDMFAPTYANQIWAPTGSLEVDPPNHEPFRTFTGEQVHDGSQYQGGALIFGFSTVRSPPPDPPGRCEYIVWINDLERGDAFVNNPNLPLDPAAGTNLAVGLALNPSDGPAPQSGFALELQESGGFAPAPDADIRAFTTPGYVGILAPTRLIGELGAANFYTFCSEEGFEFEPEESGADQTGLVGISANDLGRVELEARNLPPESTTTTTQATTTTAPPPDTTTTASVVDADADQDVDTEGFPSWLALTAVGVGLALVGWWLYNQDGDSCRELLEVWQDAERDSQEAQRKADEAAEACEAAELQRERLEDERDEVCRAWPPACWGTEEGDWMEDGHGNRITSRDIHMRKMALGEAWDDYRAGKLSVADVEERWRQMDTPEFREEMRQADRTFQERLEKIEAELAEAQREVDQARQRVSDAQEAVKEACRTAAEAKTAYENCAGTPRVAGVTETDPE